MTVRFCAKPPCGPPTADARAETENAEVAAGGRWGAIYAPGTAPVDEMLQLLRPTQRARVLRVRNLHNLQLLGSAPPAAVAAAAANWPSRVELNAITRGFWCTACPITRRGAVIHEHNKSVVREVEGFCKQETRGKLGLGPMRSCCSQQGSCHTCQPWERRPTNETKLPWALKMWVPVLAGLETLAGQQKPCSHPFCTGSDRKRFP